MTYPGWWQDGVRVVGADDARGLLFRNSRGHWLVQVDGEEPGDPVPAVPGEWDIVVDHTVTPHQLRQLAYEAERSLLRAFGCHYVPEWSAVPESARVEGDPRARAVGRPELAGLQAVVRGAILDALKDYVR